MKEETWKKGLSTALRQVEKEAEVEKVVQKQIDTEIQVDVSAKVRKQPYEPSQSEIDIHEACGHVLFRNWCAGCVAGRRPDARHERDKADGSVDHFVVPTFEFDYATLSGKTSDPDSPIPFVSGSESEHGLIHANFIQPFGALNFPAAVHRYDCVV